MFLYFYVELCGWLVSSIGVTTSASTGSTSKSGFAKVNMHNANWTTEDMTIKSKVAFRRNRQYSMSKLRW